MTTPVESVRPGPARDRGVPVYPILLGVALFFQVVATSGVGVWSALRPLAFAFVIVVAITFLIRFALGDAERAGPAAAVTILGVIFGDPRILGLALVVDVIFLVERHLMADRLALPWPTINRAGRVLATIASIAIVIQAVQVGALEVLARSATSEGPFRPARVFAAEGRDRPPDVYVLLLDGYARHDALRQEFGVDDGEFLTGLESHGLTVSAHARTNYPITVQVVMSMFHGALLSTIPELAPLLDGTYKGTEIGLTHQVVQDNPLFDQLHAKDYEIIGVTSGFAQLSLREADDFVTSGQISEFEIAMLRRTVFGDLVDALAPDFVSAQYRDRIRATWATVDQLAGERVDHPRFIFAHVPSPHPPWVFNADGSPRTSGGLKAIYEDMPDTTGMTEEQLHAGYAGAVEALWAPVLDTIDHIDREAATPPIIVVFGDHGSWVGALPGDARLRLLPLLATRVPSGAQPLAADEALVNVFADVLDPTIGTTLARVDPAPSFMFSPKGEYDLHPIDDPNGAIRTP
jgi:hypothetical protein